MPESFLQNLGKYVEHDALVFEVGRFPRLPAACARLRVDSHVGLAVMTGRLGRLAEHCVQLGPTERSKEELVAMLETRLKPIRRDVQARAATTVQGGKAR
eukprot:scaffold1223_cov380-Prasinococcus_capsulatus_cf.AAC.1